MKLILTETEMADALQHGAPIPAGYVVVNVDFQKYSADFCTLKMEKLDAATEPAVPLRAVEAAPATEDLQLGDAA